MYSIYALHHYGIKRIKFHLSPPLNHRSFTHSYNHSVLSYALFQQLLLFEIFFVVACFVCSFVRSSIDIPVIYSISPHIWCSFFFSPSILLYDETIEVKSFWSNSITKPLTFIFFLFFSFANNENSSKEMKRKKTFLPTNIEFTVWMSACFTLFLSLKYSSIWTANVEFSNNYGKCLNA